MNTNVNDKLTPNHCNRNILCDPKKANADEIKRRRILRLAQVIIKAIVLEKLSKVL